MPDRYLTLKEASEYLQYHPDSLRRKIKLGQVPAFKIGKHWRFKAAILDEWVRAGCPTQQEQPTLFDQATPGR